MRRRVLRLVTVGVLGTGIALPLAAQSVGVGPQAAKLRLAVMDLSGSALQAQMIQGQPAQGGVQTTQTMAIAPPPEFARALTEILTTVVNDTRRFVVLERKQIQAVLAEQDFNASGRVNKETAAAQGSVIGAQVMITGDITGYTYNQRSLSGNALNVVPGLNVTASSVNARVVIDLRMIDAATGEVLTSAKGTGNAGATGVAADLLKGDRQVGTSSQWNTPLGEASRRAIKEAVTQLLAAMPAVKWAAKIVEVRDDVIYLNAGADDGIKPGLVLEVYEIRPPLIDPDSGKNLGSPDRLLGEIQVETVELKYATAKTLTGSGFTRNNIVRVKGAP